MNIDFESRNITRRRFLKGAGVVGAAGLLSACGGSFQLRAFAVCVQGIDVFQRLLDLRAGKALLPQVLGRRTAALAGGKQADVAERREKSI